MRHRDGRSRRRASCVLLAALAWSWSWSSAQPARAEVPAQGEGAADATRAARLKQRDAYRARLVESARPWQNAEEGVAAAKRFIELERELNGELTPSMAFALRKLADFELQGKDDAAAVTHLHQALEVERRLHDEAHWHVSDVRRELAYAEAISRLALEQRERIASLSSAQSLGELRHALVVLRRAVGERTARYAMVQEQLAWTLRALGNPFAAAVWAERCRALRAEIEGRQHPSYLRTLRLRAMLHHDLEENDEAKKVLETADTLRRDIPDLDDSEVVELARTRGAVLRASGDLDGASRAFEEAVERVLRRAGEGSPDHVRLLAEQADLARRRRDFAAARRLWDRVIAFSRPTGVPKDDTFALVLSRAALVPHDQGDLETATKLVREAQPRDPRTASTDRTRA